MGFDSLRTGDEKTPVMDWKGKRKSCNVEDLRMISDVCGKRPEDLSLWEKSLNFLLPFNYLLPWNEDLKCKRDFLMEIRERQNQCMLGQLEENKRALQELEKEIREAERKYREKWHK